ncbi:hypothetical protein BH10ACI2_BH10ACI2_08140 [soil metagenome]
MKRLLFILVIFAGTAVASFAQTAPDAANLTALLDEFLAGAGRNDAAVHDRFWADDLIYTRSAGVRTNKPDMMKGVRSAPPAKPGDPVTVYTGEDVQIHQYGNAAVVAFKLVGTTTKQDGTKTVTNHLNTGTFIKRKGIWQAVAWQATTVPLPAAKPTSQTKPETAKSAALASMPAGESLKKQSSSGPDGRNYLKGTKGGCYYLNVSGVKVYVDHSKCP